MSVLVWDGVSLAADSMANNGSLAFPYPKVWVHQEQPRILAGAIGPLPQVELLRRWALAGLKALEYPWDAVKDAQLVVVSHDKGVVRYKNSYVPLLHGNNKIAIGEGADIAYGALHMGATAEQAVAAAINYSVHCNGVPEVLTL